MKKNTRQEAMRVSLGLSSFAFVWMYMFMKKSIIIALLLIYRPNEISKVFRFKNVWNLMFELPEDVHISLFTKTRFYDILFSSVLQISWILGYHSSIISSRVPWSKNLTWIFWFFLLVSCLMRACPQVISIYYFPLSFLVLLYISFDTKRIICLCLIFPHFASPRPLQESLIAWFINFSLKL